MIALASVRAVSPVGSDGCAAYAAALLLIAAALAGAVALWARIGRRRPGGASLGLLLALVVAAFLLALALLVAGGLLFGPFLG